MPTRCVSSFAITPATTCNSTGATDCRRFVNRSFFLFFFSQSHFTQQVFPILWNAKPAWPGNFFFRNIVLAFASQYPMIRNFHTTPLIVSQFGGGGYGVGGWAFLPQERLIVNIPASRSVPLCRGWQKKMLSYPTYQSEPSRKRGGGSPSLRRSILLGCCRSPGPLSCVPQQGRCCSQQSREGSTKALLSAPAPTTKHEVGEVRIYWRQTPWRERFPLARTWPKQGGVSCVISRQHGPAYPRPIKRTEMAEVVKEESGVPSFGDCFFVVCYQQQILTSIGILRRTSTNKNIHMHTPSKKLRTWASF